MIDIEYKNILQNILDNGKLKGDRTGTGTLSIFSGQIKHDMSKGFPLLTTKKMFTKGIIHELLWFLNGDTNIQYLVKNGVNIWTPDAYREYEYYASSIEGVDYDIHIEDDVEHRARVMNIDEFKLEIINNDRFAERFGELGPIYGKQWVNWGNPMGNQNQIQNAIDALNNNPDSRRIMVNAWNVGEIDKMALPPCHWAFELYAEELTEEERFNLYVETCNKLKTPSFKASTDKDQMEVYYQEYNIPTRRLSLKWHQRSVDTFLGLPFNIASYGMLLEMFAQQTNMVAGTLIGDLTNVHIYNNHIEQCKEQLLREPMELPSISLDKAKDIFSYKYEDFHINDYESHPTIKGKISV